MWHGYAKSEKALLTLTPLRPLIPSIPHQILPIAAVEYRTRAGRLIKNLVEDFFYVFPFAIAQAISLVGAVGYLHGAFVVVATTHGQVVKHQQIQGGIVVEANTGRRRVFQH